MPANTSHVGQMPARPRRSVGRHRARAAVTAVAATAAGWGVRAARADNYTLTATDAGGTSSLAGTATNFHLNGSASGATSNPATDAGADAYNTSSFYVRTPTGTFSLAFNGSSLTVDAGGRLLGKTNSTTGSTLAVSNLILNGGLIDQANTSGDGAVLILSGNLTVDANSFLGANAGEFLVVQSALNGTAGLTIGYQGAPYNSVDTGAVQLLNVGGNYSGNLNVSSGTLLVGNGGTAGTLGTGAVAVQSAGTLAFNQSGAVSVANAITGAGTLTILGGGTFTLTTAESIGTFLARAGTTVLAANVTAGNAAVGYNAGDVAVMNVPAGTTFNAGGGSFYIGRNAGATGTVNLSGGTLLVNGFAAGGNPGTLNLDGGTLRASANSTAFTAGIATANVLAGGATIDTGAFNVSFGKPLLASPTSPGGGLTKLGAGTLTLLSPPTYTGPTLVSAGTLSLSNSANGFAALTNTSAVTIAAGATLSDGIPGANAISAVIGGGGTLVQNGGVLTLTGANTFTGNTLVIAGAIRADNTAGGSGTGTGTALVSPGATLGGNGSAGAVVVAGTITAGADPATVGTLTTGAQTWNGSGGYLSKVTAEGTANDRLVMSGLTIAATALTPVVATVSGLGGAGSPTVYTTAQLTAAPLVLATDTDGGQAGVFQSAINAMTLTLATSNLSVSDGVPSLAEVDIGGVEQLVLTAAPEPTSFALVVAAAAPLALGRRRADRRTV